MIKAITSLFGSFILFTIAYLLASGHPDILCLFYDPLSEIAVFLISICSGVTLVVSALDDIKTYWKS